MKKLLFLLFLLCALPAQAQNIDYSNFREIPVLHEGRVKPMESLARAYLLALHGKSTLPKMTASEWLAELLFDPAHAAQRDILNIPNPELVAMLGLTGREGHQYNYNDVSSAMEKQSDTLKAIDAIDSKDRTASQQQLLELYDKLVAFTMLSESFSLLEPRFHIGDAVIAQRIHVPAKKDLTFLDLMPHEHEILAPIEQFKDKKPDQMTSTEREQAILALEYLHVAEQQHATLLRIVPPQWQMDKGEWVSPWALIMDGHGSPQSAAYLDLWQKLGIAYAHHNQGQWQEYGQQLHDMAFSLAGPNASLFKMRLEVFYLQGDFFTYALALYIGAFLLMMISTLSGHRIFTIAAATLLPVGALLQLLALAMRITIMGRPPVATLYETTIFVSLIAVILAWLFELKKRDGVGLTVGSIIGSVLLFISTRYAAEGDTMEMLVAVLNTNFWLATHVVTVTIGYGCSLVAGTLGHIYLLRRCLKPNDAQAQQKLIDTILAVALIAAFFATLGTILGGIWADQSWGWFWGWDPKENGAMLIVLWLLWLLHGRIAGKLKPLDFVTAATATNIIVALSWFGVNLLGVGLHSYGFTNHIAVNLGAFCGAECLFIASLRGILSSRGIKA